MNLPTSSLALGFLACTGGASSDTSAFSGEPILGDYKVVYTFQDRDCYGVADVFYDSAGPTTWQLEAIGNGQSFVGLETETGWHFECLLEEICFDCTQTSQQRDWSPIYDALQTITLDIHGHWNTRNSFTGELIYDTSCEGSECALLAYDTGMLEGFPCTMAHWSFAASLLD
jgi:hypothetical protein